MSKMTVKSEPAFPLTHELDVGVFGGLLSWYAANCDADDAAKFFREYLTKHEHIHTEASVAAFVRYAPTIGFVCRIIMRGAKIPASSQRWVNAKIAEFETFKPPTPTAANDRPKKEETPKVSVQDRMKQQVSRCLADLESALDSYILSEFKDSMPPIAIMRQHDIKGPQATQVINWFKRFRDEYRVAASSSDPDIREAYSNFTKPQLNKLATYCDQMITDALVLVKESLQKRSPRTRKKKLPEQIVKSVQYCVEDAELQLTSVEPTAMIGAMSAWTYHIPTRTLTLHVADDASGLSFKGTTVVNTNASLCVSKKLRKPQDTLKEVLNGSKSITKKLMESLTTKPTKYKNRLNKETLIIRCHK